MLVDCVYCLQSTARQQNKFQYWTLNTLNFALLRCAAVLIGPTEARALRLRREPICIASTASVNEFITRFGGRIVVEGRNVGTAGARFGKKRAGSG